MFTTTGLKFFFQMTAKSASLPLQISSSGIWNPSGEKCENHPRRSPGTRLFEFWPFASPCCTRACERRIVTDPCLCASHNTMSQIFDLETIVTNPCLCASHNYRLESKNCLVIVTDPCLCASHNYRLESKNCLVTVTDPCLCASHNCWPCLSSRLVIVTDPCLCASHNCNSHIDIRKRL